MRSLHCLEMARFTALAALAQVAVATQLRPIFGIGVYNDTPGSPLVADQIEVAFNLTGQGGYVLLFFETFNPADPSTLFPEPWQISALERVYELGLKPVVRLGQAARNYRYFSDDVEHLHYTHLASQYAAFVDSLPLPPPALGPLYVGVGNEFNVHGEWLCTEGAGVFMNVSQVAIEAAGFERDVLAALRPLPRLSLGMVPLAQVQASAFECTWNGSQIGPYANGTLFAQVRHGARCGRLSVVI